MEKLTTGGVFVKKIPHIGFLMAGLGAGAVNGLFGAGGGMILVPLLTGLTDLREEEVFPSSVSIILPISLISLGFSLWQTGMNWNVAFPYLIGSTAGGILAGVLGNKLSVKWLHKLLGALILWGGVRYLC